MKKAIVGFFVALLIVGAYFLGKKENQITTISGSGVLEEKLKNVSKLIVTEGHYSDIITYEDAKSLSSYLSWVKAEKKAVVLVNAKATIAYDLSRLEFVLNEENKTLQITFIPEPELQIYPKLEYYDIQEDFLNEFIASDYNKISDLVDGRLKHQIQSSDLIKNSQNRLISELHALLNREGLNFRVEFNKDAKTELLK